MKPRLKPSKQAEEMYRLWQKRNEEEMPVKAFSTLIEAARLGSEEAQVALAYKYAYGVIGNANEKRALQLWKRAYRRGSWEAAFNLGMWYRDKQEWNKAVRWFERAVEAGDEDGLVEIAKIHLRYRGDQAEGLRYLKLATAAKKKLTKPAHIKLEKLLKDQKELTPGNLLHREADLLDEQGKYAKALPLLIKGAELGDDGCQILLGNYLTGVTKGVAADWEKGIFWYKQAYKQGCSTAAQNLAVTYRHAGNLSKALLWYGRAIKAGSESAHLALAKLALRTENDEKKALEHLNAIFNGNKQYSGFEEDEARVMLRRLANNPNRRRRQRSRLTEGRAVVIRSGISSR